MKDRWLFKAKTVNENEWIQGITIAQGTIPRKRDNFYMEVGQDWKGIKKDTICACTGLKDSEGNLVFENDLLFNESNYKMRVEDNEKMENYHNHTVKIIWENDGFKKIITKQKNYYFAKLPSQPQRIFKLDYYKIIGNIHNKE